MDYSPQGSSSRDVLVKNATQGGLALGGGIALLIFKGIASIGFFGPLVGAAMIIGGLFMRGKGRGDKLSSTALIVLGALAVATIIPVIGGLSKFIMLVSGLGLVVFGAVKLWKYFRGYKNRSM